MDYLFIMPETFPLNAGGVEEVIGYVTLTEANEYITLMYVSTDERRIEWESLIDADKEVYLRQALAKIETLRFTGRKCGGNEQVLSFPRRKKRLYPERRNYNRDKYCTEYDLLEYNYECEEVPNDIKQAQILEAFEIAVPSEDSDDFDNYNGNLMSFSITGLSETYKTASNGDTSSIKTTIISKQAQRLLSKYIGGGYRVV